MHTISQYRVLRGCIATQEQQQQKQTRHDRAVSLLWSFLIALAAWVMWADRKGPMAPVDVAVGFGIASAVVLLLAMWGRK